MSHVVPDVPPEQRAIRATCVCPAGTVAEFTNDEVEHSIPGRLETIVRNSPDRLAAKMGSHVVTYAELNAMANRVARSVLSQPGDNDEPVALLLDKGIGQIAAMLGTLKAGRCFVLLDPSFPTAKLTATLEDSQAGLVLTDGENASRAKDSAFRGSHLIELDSVDCDPSSGNLGLTISSNALAYITYTSGSTGRPKGVVQTHRNVLHNVMRRTRATPLCVHDRLPLLTYGTSNAVSTTMFALLNGAILLPFDLRNEGVARLADWLRRERITVLWISSPVFRNLCELLTDKDTFPDVRLLRLMSDAVYKTDVDLYKTHFPLGCVFVNGLHSSETGALRSYLMTHDTEISGHEVPLGYPVEDQDILLLDDEGQNVGFNEVGEIVVRSKYLSPGYWKRPDLTDAKYRRDPDDNEKRLYHSGDLGLMLPDGCLIHKGRKDFRVKIRGYGVEIAEVEKALLSHPGINQLVVVARPNDAGEASLIAYFTSSAGATPAVGGLRNYLREKLPDYMIPSRLIRLDALPLTSGGKVDRGALPDPGGSRPALDTPFVEPTSSVEEQLTQIWAEVLALDRVGIHDNFFELGGHSLAAAGVVARVIKTFHVELPMKALFESPTVAAMAEVITRSPLKEPTEDDVNRVLSELEALSDEDAARLLANEIRDNRRDGRR